MRHEFPANEWAPLNTLANLGLITGIFEWEYAWQETQAGWCDDAEFSREAISDFRQALEGQAGLAGANIGRMRPLREIRISRRAWNKALRFVDLLKCTSVRLH